MSSTDDQRADEAEYERLRTAVMGQAKEIDRLRAELAETRAAGDAMARELGGASWHSGVDALEAWRSVRGDAPTAGGLLPDKRILIDLTPPSRAIPADQRRKLAAELRSRFVDGPVDEWSAGWLSAAGYIGSDSPIGTDAGTDLAAPAVAPTEPPAADGAECHAATFDGHGCLGRVVDGQCTEQDDHHPTPGMVPCCGPGEHDDQTAVPDARPAAGRDLTAQDVQRAYDGTMRWEPIADYLNGIARPAVARTDGQPPADGVAPPRCDPAAGIHVLPHRGCILR